MSVQSPAKSLVQAAETGSIVPSQPPGESNDEPPIPVSSPSSTHSDQFDDAPEAPQDSLREKKNHTTTINPLEALAMACVAEKDNQEKKALLSPSAEDNQEKQSWLSPYATPSFQISHNDVLCGRGGLTNHHPGNVFFRRLVRMKQEAYLLATKREKAGVAREIVDVIRNLSPPGRFLKKDQQNPGVWVEIGDRKAREKTSQALREGAPELREELQTSECQQEKRTRSLSDSARAVLSSMRMQIPPQQFVESPPPLHAVGQSPLQPRLTLSTHEPMKPLNVASSRARVVSDDAGVLGLQPLFHQIHDHPPPHVVVDEVDQSMAGSGQRRFAPDVQPSEQLQVPSSLNLNRLSVADEVCGVEQGAKNGEWSTGQVVAKRKTYSSDVDDTHENARPSKRGPRLKLLKSRLQSSD